MLARSEAEETVLLAVGATIPGTSEVLPVGDTLFAPIEGGPKGEGEGVGVGLDELGAEADQPVVKKSSCAGVIAGDSSG